MRFLDYFNKKVLIPLLILMVFFSPRFGNLRLQDIIILIAVVLTVASYISKNGVNLKNNFTNSELNRIIKLKVLSLFLLLLLNLYIVVSGNIPFYPYVFYYLKEVQYFVLFVLLIFHFDNVTYYYKFFVVSLLVQMLWGLIQLLSGNHYGFYGIGLLGEKGPSQSGVLYFISYSIFVSRLYCLLLNKSVNSRQQKITLNFLLSVIAFILVNMTVSRTSIMATLFVTFILFLSLLSRLKYPRKIIGYMIILFFIIFIVLRNSTNLIDNKSINYVLMRLGNIPNGIMIRLRKWYDTFFIIFDSPIQVLIGRGTGIHNYIFGTKTLSVDSNYFRVLFEQGLVGLALFFIYIYYIYDYINQKAAEPYKISWKIITIGMLMIGITHEVFYVVKSSEIFWLYTAMIISNVLLSEQ